MLKHNYHIFLQLSKAHRLLINSLHSYFTSFSTHFPNLLQNNRSGQPRAYERAFPACVCCAPIQRDRGGDRPISSCLYQDEGSAEASTVVTQNGAAGASFGGYVSRALNHLPSHQHIQDRTMPDSTAQTKPIAPEISTTGDEVALTALPSKHTQELSDAYDKCLPS